MMSSTSEIFFLSHLVLSEESSSQHTHREVCLLFLRCGESPRRCRAYPWPFYGKRPALSKLVSVKGRRESSFGWIVLSIQTSSDPSCPLCCAIRRLLLVKAWVCEDTSTSSAGEFVGGHASVAHSHSYTIGPFIWFSTQWGSLSVSTSYFFPDIETSRLFLVSSWVSRRYVFFLFFLCLGFL